MTDASGETDMTDAEYARKLDELDRLLNDPDVPMEPAKVWSLLAEIAQQDMSHRHAEASPPDAQALSAAIRNSRLPSGPVIGLSVMPITRQSGSAVHQALIRSHTAL